MRVAYPLLWHFICGCLLRKREQSELPRGIKPRMHVDDNVTLTSQKPCQYNNKFDCSKTNGYDIPQDAINEVRFFFNMLLKKHKLHLFC